jgi:NAD(P)-dependent dehydrogenase (short-subunit alcohol dehydrogenase family)
MQWLLPEGGDEKRIEEAVFGEAASHRRDFQVCISVSSSCSKYLHPETPPIVLYLVRGPHSVLFVVGIIVNVGAQTCAENGNSRSRKMANVFGATSTTDEVLSGVNLKGKRILVTGVSAGIGVETARALAAHGAQVVGAARDLSKAEAATVQVRKDAATNGGSFKLIPLDLADLKSVRTCADGLLAKGEEFNVVIANAGVMATPFGHTADGFETQFGTNHLGHFVFVNRIASLIPTGGRLINLASSGHRFANVDLEDPNFERTPYEPFVAYGRSKTANILFAVGFDQRHRERGVRAAAVHPGGIHTELARHMDPNQMQAMIGQITRQLEEEGKGAFTLKTIPQGAATSVWAGVVASADEVAARYCENCQVGNIIADDVTVSASSEGVRAYALDPGNAEALWKKSEKLVGESF